MGHTLVAQWNNDEFSRISRLAGLQPAGRYNKIPFGRNCDREDADLVLPYHMTVFHWRKSEDGRYLDRLNSLVFHPFRILVDAADVMCAEEGSFLLYLSVSPGAGYFSFVNELERILDARTSGFLHITVAVSKDENEISTLYRNISGGVTFPFSVSVSTLALYHIWNPVRLVKTWV